MYVSANYLVYYSVLYYLITGGWPSVRYFFLDLRNKTNHFFLNDVRAGRLRLAGLPVAG